MVKVSVVIPTYGRPYQLQACVAALEESAFRREDFEVVVVDDGSPEPVESQLSGFTRGFPLYVLRQANAGAAAARNAGAVRASGRFVAFIDDDCLVERGWLRAVYKRLEAEPNSAVGGKTVNAASDNVYARVSHLLTYKMVR